MISRSAAWTLAAALSLVIGAAVHITHLTLNKHHSEALGLATIIVVLIVVAVAVWIVLDEAAMRREVRQREYQQELAAHTERVMERAVQRVAARVETDVERVSRLLAKADQTVVLPKASRQVSCTTYAPIQDLDINQSAMYMEMIERTGDVAHFREIHKPRNDQNNGNGR